MLSGEEEDAVVALVPTKQREICGLGGRVYPEPPYFTPARARRCDAQPGAGARSPAPLAFAEPAEGMT